MRHEELSGFLKQMKKRGIEKMLEGEFDWHLDYDKHQKSGGRNVRSGYSRMKIKTSFGESEIAVPRDWEASFNPTTVPKGYNMVHGIENVIMSLYAEGLSNSDIEE
jgi:putative transposase